MRQQPYIHLYEQYASGSGEWNAVFALLLSSCTTERMEQNGEHSIIMQRLLSQADFITTLSSPNLPFTFAIRYVSFPNWQCFAAGRIEIALLVKVPAREKEMAEIKANNLFLQIVALLDNLMPNYSWKAINQPTSFYLLWKPFCWQKAHFAEIGRRTERLHLPIPRTQSQPNKRLSFSTSAKPAASPFYFVHPFVARPTTLERLLHTMLLHPVPLVLHIAIASTRLTDIEETMLTEQISVCGYYKQQPDTLLSPVFGQSQTIHQLRAKTICTELLARYARLQTHPLVLNIMLASPEPLPRMLVDSIGVELTAPIWDGCRTGEPNQLQLGGFEIFVPKNGTEQFWACENIRGLEFNYANETEDFAELNRLHFLVDPIEAAAVFRLPIATAHGLPGINVQITHCRPLPREIAHLNENLADSGSLLLGQNNYLGHSQPVFIPEQARGQHMFVVGATGTGKTTLLKTMIQADMAAGRGVALIDPHGDLFIELLNSVPPHRWNDVVVLDPTDTSWPVGVNLLECTNEHDRYFVVRKMKTIMEHLLGEQFQSSSVWCAGPIFYQHVQMNLLLAMSDPNDPGTLLEFCQIFQQDDYWKRWLPLKHQDEQLKNWVGNVLPKVNYLHRSSVDSSSLGEYISSKFEDFIFDPKLRLIFGQKRSTIDFAKIMNEGKILLVNLAKGALSESTARFFGMVLLAKLQEAALERVKLPAHERRMFYLYVDECPSLATQDFVVLLSEARKFGLNLVMASQYVSQIKDDRIINAILGNVGNLISFRLGANDAKILEPQFAPFFDYYDLVNLPNWQACVKTNLNGQAVMPFNLHTVLPAITSGNKVGAKVRVKSNVHYSRMREDVEKEIAQSLRRNW